MSSHDYGELFEWGLKDGIIVHVNDVENGLSCSCICPACETPLIAFNNPKNIRANHFRHKRIINCQNAYETALHYLAKQIISEIKIVIVPDVKYKQSKMACLQNQGGAIERQEKKRVLMFSKVEVEKGEVNFRPDLKCYIDEKVLLVEIAVTHFVDQEKKKKIEEAGIPLLEIDLSNFDRSIQHIKLRKILKGDISYMRWIYNPKIEERHKEAASIGIKIRELIKREVKSHKVYGKAEYIYDCPIHKRSDRIKVRDVCMRCHYFVDKYPRLFEHTITSDATLHCVGHVSVEYDQLFTGQKIT